MNKAIEYLEALLMQFDFRKFRVALLVIFVGWLAWTYQAQFLSIDRLQQAREIEKLAEEKLAVLDKRDAGKIGEDVFWEERLKNARLEIKRTVEGRYVGWMPWRWIKGVWYPAGLLFLPVAVCLIWIMLRWEDWKAWAKRNLAEERESEPRFFCPIMTLILALGLIVVVGVAPMAAWENEAAAKFHVRLDKANPNTWSAFFNKASGSRNWKVVHSAGPLLIYWLFFSIPTAGAALSFKKEGYREARDRAKAEGGRK